MPTRSTLVTDPTGRSSRVYANTVRKNVSPPSGTRLHMHVTKTGRDKLKRSTWEDVDNGRGDILWELRSPGKKTLRYCTAPDAARTAPHERFETRIVPTTSALSTMQAPSTAPSIALTLIQMGVALLKEESSRAGR